MQDNPHAPTPRPPATGGEPPAAASGELRYRQLFENMASGHALHAIEVDAAGRPVNYRFLAMNAAFSAMLGIEAATAVGARITDVYPAVASDPADWIGRFGRVALTGEPARFELSEDNFFESALAS